MDVEVIERIFCDNTLSSINSLPPNITEVKVDRTLLEKMLGETHSSIESAKDFFARVSDESGAIITFPQLWKLETMARKDPEVRIIGTASQVSRARKMIMDVMDPNRNRITFKIDVSFADHSFIIGKGGKRIQSIMSETGAMIHFPDENLWNAETKSNLVTITCDSLRKADLARQLIRQSHPLTLAFHVYECTENASLFSDTHPMVQYCQRRFNVLISFTTAPLNPTESSPALVSVMVRGSRRHFNQLYEATTALYSLLHSTNCGLNSKTFEITIEISARHHPFVMGTNSANIKRIHNRTGAIISFPGRETNTANSSKVIIKGIGIESTFMAWLQILDCLPIVMIFDIKEENLRDIYKLIGNPLLSVNTTTKVNSNKICVVIKTQERYMYLLFEVRKYLNIEEECVSPVGKAMVCDNSDPKGNHFTELLNTMSYIQHEF